MSGTWKNLAPQLTRQRLIIEGLTRTIVEPAVIARYLTELSNVLGVKIRGGPLTYSAEDETEGAWSALNMGYAGWLYWVSSGVHFHSYPTDPPLFSVDAYTCKPIDVQRAVAFTKDFLNTIDLVWREIMV